MLPPAWWSSKISTMAVVGRGRQRSPITFWKIAADLALCEKTAQKAHYGITAGVAHPMEYTMPDHMRPKKGVFVHGTPQLRAALLELNDKSPRTVALVGAAIVEEELSNYILKKLRLAKRVVERELLAAAAP